MQIHTSNRNELSTGLPFTSLLLNVWRGICRDVSVLWKPCCESASSWLCLEWVSCSYTTEVYYEKNITCSFFFLGKIVCEWRKCWWISRHCSVPFCLLPINAGESAINWSAWCYWGQNSNQGEGKDLSGIDTYFWLIYVLQQDCIKSDRNPFVPALSWHGRENRGVGCICEYRCHFLDA